MPQTPRWYKVTTNILGAFFVLMLPFSSFFPLGDSVDPEIIPIYGSVGLYLTDIAITLVIIAGVIVTLKRKASLRSRFYFGGVGYVPIFLIPLLGCLTIPWALNLNLALYSAIRWTLTLLVFLAWQVLETDNRQLIRVFLYGLAFQAVVGILQVINRGPLGLPTEMALAVDRPRAAVLWLEGQAWLRAYGLTFHPNVLGGFLAVGLVLGLPEVKNWAGRIVWWVMLAGLLVTFSRSAWLAAGLTVLPLGIWLYRQYADLRKPLLIILGAAAGLGLIGGAVLQAPILSRFNIFSSFSEYTSISARGELMNLAIQSIRQNPVTGIGAGNFPLLTLHSNVHDAAHSVHNVSLLLGAEIGIVGAALWYWLWMGPIFSVVKGLRSVNAQTLALAAAWFAIGLIALWDSYPWSLEAGRMLSVTLLAWLVNQSRVVFAPQNKIFRTG